MAGHRGYFLTNDGVDLNHAMIAYGLDFLRQRGYKKMQAPFLMNKDVMAKTAQLDQFDEELYKVDCRDLISPSLSFWLRAKRPTPSRLPGQKRTNTSLQRRSSLYRRTTRMNGLKIQKSSYLSSTRVTRHASAKKLALLGEICGGYSAFISLRK